MCDIDLKTCEKSSKYKKKDIVDLGKKCGVDPYLPNGREKTRQVICTEIVNQYSANPSSSSQSDSEDDEGPNGEDPICGISEKKCLSLDKIDGLALGEHCGVNIYSSNGKLKPIKSICKSVAKSNGGAQSPKKSPTKNDIKNMDISELKKLAKKLDIDWKGKNMNELQYIIIKKLNSIRSVSPSPVKSVRSPSRSRSPSPLALGIENMKKKELKALAKALGASEKKIDGMDKDGLIQYILSRKKSPSVSPKKRSASPRKSRSRTPQRSRSRSRSSAVKYRAADLLGKKVAELKDMAKLKGLKKWKDKTPSKMLKQDFVDFLLHVGGGGPVPKTQSPIKPVSSPKSRAELMLLKVPELKALALSYGLKKFKDKTPSQLRKNDFIDFIISNYNVKPRSPSPRPRSISPPKYKSRDLVIINDDSEDEEVVVQKVSKKKPSIRRSRSPSITEMTDDEEEVIQKSPNKKKRLPPASVRRSRSPSVRPKPPSVRPKSPSVRPKSPSVRPKSPSVRPKSPSVRAEITDDEDETPPPSVRPKSPSVRPKSPSVRPPPPPPPDPSNSPSIIVDPSVTPPTSVKIKKRPELPEYKGKNADRDLEILARRRGYKVVPVKGDGNCLFRAVGKSLRLNQNIKYSHEELRAQVVTYLTSHEEFLEPYLEYVTESGDTTPQEYAKNVKRYIKNISRSGTWGDFICLRVLSEILKVKFNLLILNTRSFQVVSNNDTFKPLIPLGFIDDYHYTALTPLHAEPITVLENEIPTPSVAPSIRPSVVPPSIRPSIAPSIRPSVVPGSVAPSPIPGPSFLQPTPSIAPQIPPPVFGKVKQLSSVNELLEIMDKVKPYVYDDISQLQKAERQIMVSLGM